MRDIKSKMAKKGHTNKQRSTNTFFYLFLFIDTLPNLRTSHSKQLLQLCLFVELTSCRLQNLLLKVEYRRGNLLHWRDIQAVASEWQTSMNQMNQ